MAPRIIKDTATGSVIDVKRFYLPGVTVEDDCPSCGKIWTWDGDNEYLSYPIMGDKVDLYAACECGANWDIKITLGVKISL
jgi:hypothetical protein